jgi:hypothetical protein
LDKEKEPKALVSGETEKIDWSAELEDPKADKIEALMAEIKTKGK